MPVIDVTNSQLNLAAVLLNGQSFRWLEKNGIFYGNAISRLWKIARINKKQIEYNVVASLPESTSAFDEDAVLRAYFNLPVDLEELYTTWADSDPHMNKILAESEHLKGIRILGQEPLETLFAFICSANNNIKRISKMVNRMCTLYGSQLTLTENIEPEDRAHCEEFGHLLYAFPTAEQLQKNVDKMEKQLREDGFGYRAQYIAESVRLMASKKISLDELRYPNDARESLLQFTGVGPKVADCVSLMGLGHHHVVPIDTHVFKCTVKNYRQDLEGKAIQTSFSGKFYLEKFGTHAGWAQAVIFNAQLLSKETKKPKSTTRKRKST